MSSRENFDQTVMLLACLFRNILRPLAFANLRPAYAGGRWVRIALRSGSCGSIARAAHMPARPAGSVTRRTLPWLPFSPGTIKGQIGRAAGRERGCKYG